MDQRIPIKVNTQLNERSARVDSPHHSVSSSSSDIRDKMQQRMREFEEESRRWREQFMSNSASASSPLASMDAYSRPRMLVNSFPEFPEMNWTSPSHGVTSLGRSGGSSLFSSAVNSSSSSQNNSHKSFIEEDNDGNKKYKLQFDIGDFKPNEIQVRTEGRMLIVKGGHEIHAGTASESKQFNRELTLPEFVEPTTVTSYLCDGMLTIDAPVIMDRFSINAAGQQQNTSAYNTIQSSMSNNNSRRSPFRDQISPPRGTLLTTINTNSPNSSISSSSSSNQMAINALSSPNNSSSINSSTIPTYRFNLSEFRPEDISITVTDTTLNIHAVREEMEPRGMYINTYMTSLRNSRPILCSKPNCDFIFPNQEKRSKQA
jgi:HSP20 family molecular chaperone IbpA